MRAGLLILVGVAITGCMGLDGLSRNWPPAPDVIYPPDRGDASPSDPRAADLAEVDGASPDLAQPPDLAVHPDLAETVSGDLSGCQGYVDPQIGGCWYLGGRDQSCREICGPHGGFDAKGSQHVGDPIMKHFYPRSLLFQNVSLNGFERMTPDLLYRWPADGTLPEDFVAHAQPFACSCRR